jgi:uncharacterized protein YdiU (UPF0061 family)
MNTDNMSILGLTIDYGPYGWLEDYNPNWTPNITDAAEHRYRFGNQAQIALWNLGQLANAIYPIIEAVEPLQQALALYTDSYEQGWQNMMTAKLGLTSYQPQSDAQLISELLQVLQLVETDMTIFFRNLAWLDCYGQTLNNASDDTLIAPMMTAYYQPEKMMSGFKTRIANWIRHYIKRVRQDATSNALRRKTMNAVNPKYVLRNYLAQLAIDKAEKGDFSKINELLEILRRPYEEQPQWQEYAEKRPDWAKLRAGCSMLSCSS